MKKLNTFSNLLRNTPPLTKFVLTDFNDNSSTCILLNNEIFMDTGNIDISTGAINAACDALSSALDTDAELIEKTHHDSPMLFNWREFKTELDAYIEDCLLHDGAMPVEFEYECIVFDSDEYQHFVNLDESERHTLKIADHAGETRPLFAEMYGKEVQDLALCLELNTDNINQDDIECTQVVMRSESLQKMVVLRVAKIQSQIDPDEKSALFYMTFDNDWVNVSNELKASIEPITQISYTLSCDPLTLMQAKDVVVTSDIKEIQPRLLDNIKVFVIRTFNVIKDSERSTIPVSIA
jgi:hypothetical protein